MYTKKLEIRGDGGQTPAVRLYSFPSSRSHSSSSRGLTTGSKSFYDLSSLRRQGSNFLPVFDMDFCLRRKGNLFIQLDPAIKSRDDGICAEGAESLLRDDDFFIGMEEIVQYSTMGRI